MGSINQSLVNYRLQFLCLQLMIWYLVTAMQIWYFWFINFGFSCLDLVAAVLLLKFTLVDMLLYGNIVMVDELNSHWRKCMVVVITGKMCIKKVTRRKINVVNVFMVRIFMSPMVVVRTNWYILISKILHLYIYAKNITKNNLGSIKTHILNLHGRFMRSIKEMNVQEREGTDKEE